MGHRSILSFVLLLAAVASAAQDTPSATEPPVSKPPDPDAVRIRIRLMEAAVDGAARERDAGRFKSYLAPEAVFLTKDANRGPDEVAAAWKPFFQDDGPAVSHTPERIEVAASGDLAYAVGNVRVSRTDPRTGRTVSRDGPYLRAWASDGEGKWKMLGSGAFVVCREEACKKDVDWRAGLAEVWPPLKAASGDEGVSLTKDVAVTWESTAGDLAVHTGAYTVTAPGATSTETASGGYLSVLRKDAEGVYQVVAESFSVPR